MIGRLDPEVSVLPPANDLYSTDLTGPKFYRFNFNSALAPPSFVFCRGAAPASVVSGGQNRIRSRERISAVLASPSPLAPTEAVALCSEETRRAGEIRGAGGTR
uniref:Uncharacterized protein n=1 Tax=Oryza brachyantha TaxID=4533 RepID=J3M2C4_ORYBR